MNREVANGMLIGLAIGLTVSLLYAPEEWIRIKKKMLQRLPSSTLEHIVSELEAIAEEEIH